MVRDEADIDVTELDFPDGGAHFEAHGITPDDLIAVLQNGPEFYVNQPGRTASHVMVGATIRVA